MKEEEVRTLWLIPARGGSKGIPNKNLKPFCGESLVSRSVRQALACADSHDRIFVSTDSPFIAEEGRKHGIEVPFMRPDDLSGDKVPTYDVIRHVIEEFEARGETFHRVVLLQPTSPFRKLEDIKGSIKVWNPDLDMVVSVCQSKSNPYYNMFELDSEGYLNVSKGDGQITRRQDAPPVFEYNGAVYVMTVDSLMKSPISKFSKIIPYEMSASSSIDLDTPEDWEIAEILYKKRELKA